MDNPFEILDKKYQEEPFKKIEKSLGDLLREISKEDYYEKLNEIANKIPDKEIKLYGWWDRARDTLTKNNRYKFWLVPTAAFVTAFLASLWTDAIPQSAGVASYLASLPSLYFLFAGAFREPHKSLKSVKVSKMKYSEFTDIMEEFNL